MEVSYKLDFSKCSVKDFPSDKKDFTQIVETLKCFSDSKLLESRNRHKLTKKNVGKEADRIISFINLYDSVYSLDVYHRNGHKGGVRLLYTPDYDDSTLIYILDCFIDTH
ncbi:MAG: hypothetical protein K6E22_12770 [Treponema sp.]|nr:hypothetical protein [Treponema sp.]